MTDVLLATSTGWEEGEPGHDALDAALSARGIASRWAVWDDPFVDWSEARLVCVRSTWDYDQRLADFLGWAQSVGPRLVHGVEAFRWNTDKRYLAGLARWGTVPVVPTVVADTPVEVRGAVSRLGTAVVKPRVGASGRGVTVVRDGETWRPTDPGPWVVQPLLDSVFDEGESSVFVFGGRPLTQVDKVAGPADIRVQSEYGGTERAVPLDPEAALLAVDAVAATTEATGCEIVYARVDMLRLEGTLVVSEVEITEPGLYLDLVPANAHGLAGALRDQLDRR